MSDNKLVHYGVPGMRWGVRRSNAQLARARKSSKKSKTEDVHDDYKKAHDKKSVKSMSDTELRNRNNRLQMEKTHAQLTAKKSKGKKAVDTFVATAGTITAIAGAIGVYAKYGPKITAAVKQLNEYRTGKIWLY